MVLKVKLPGGNAACATGTLPQDPVRQQRGKKRALGVLSWQPLGQGWLNSGFVSDSLCYLTCLPGGDAGQSLILWVILQ